MQARFREDAVPATLPRFHGKKILPNLCKLYLSRERLSHKNYSHWQTLQTFFKKKTAKLLEIFIGNLNAQVP